MQTINRDDNRITYGGRWESGQTGWQGAIAQFKVIGNLNVELVCDIVDPATDNQAFVAIEIDKADAVFVPLTELAEIFTGQRSHNFLLPNTDEHTITIRSFMWPQQQWDFATDKNVINSIVIDDGAVLSEWNDGVTVTGYVGDSWMGASNGWPMLLSDRYKLWPLSFGGAKASTLDAKIDYMYSGKLETTEDPVMDIIFVNSSVNDYNALVPEATFEASLGSLVDKLRAQQPTAYIFIIGSPDNDGAGKIFSKYDPNMANVAAARNKVDHVPINQYKSLLSWIDDNHIDYDSRLIVSDIADAAVIARLGYQVQAGSTRPWITANRLLPGRYATEYDGLTPYSFNKPASEPVTVATPGVSGAFIG